MPIGGLGCHIAHQVDMGDNAFHGPPEPVTEAGIGNHCIGAAQPRDIVGFAWRLQGDDAPADLRIEHGQGEVAFVALQNEIGMNFIAADDEIVPVRQVGNGQQFCPTPDPAHRIVGIAEQQQPGPGGDGPGQGIDIHAPAAPLLNERYGHAPLPHQLRRAHKGRIDRGTGEDLISWLPHRPADRIQPGNQSRQPDQPLRFYAPMVVALEMGQNSLDQ